VALTRKISKILAVSLFLIFLVGLSVPSNAASIWDKRKGGSISETASLEDSTETSGDSLNPLEISIPEEFGTIIETYEGLNGNLIVHIQDAHANYEGQKNLANILESLVENYGLNLILREGGFTDADFTHLRARASLGARKRAADRLLREAIIAGEDYLNIATDYPLFFQGIEDRELYEINGEAFWEIEELKGPALEYAYKMIGAADALKPYIYNEELVSLDDKKKAYDTQAIDLLEYYEYLYRKAEENEIPLYTFPNFQNLIKANELEKKIAFIKIDSGSASDEEIKIYEEYLQTTKELNINGIFKEEPLLEGTLQDVLATKYDQKKLLEISKASEIMKNLLKVKVVPEEYRYFTDNMADFDPEYWVEFLKEKSLELNLSLDIPTGSHVIKDNLPKIKRFYSTAIEREKAFLKKTSERMEREEVNLAVLIAGGFHTPTLTKLLRADGYSYVVVSPKVTTETDEDLYKATLRRK